MRARTTGSFAVHSSITGRDVTPRGRKARALLAYLVSDPGIKISKDRLHGLLWGGRGDAQARSSLRQALLELRNAMEESQVIFSDREHIWIAPTAFSEDPLNAQTECKDAFEDLENITAEFDEWLFAERNRRVTARIAELKARAQELLRAGLAAESAATADQIQALDPCDEEAVRLGMEAEFQRGNSAGIAKRYEAMAAALKVEVGVEPSSKSRLLRGRLLSQLVIVDCASSARMSHLYEEVERSLQMGAWECDLATGEICWTSGTFVLFGLPVGSTVRREEILEQYAARSREHLERARTEAIRTGTGFDVEVEILTRAGVSRRLRISAAVESRNGVPVRIFGTKHLIS